jgi:hypothetical protein
MQDLNSDVFSKDSMGTLPDVACFHQLKYFLEIVYNTERIHSALNYLTPSEFEARFYQPQLSQFA